MNYNELRKLMQDNVDKNFTEASNELLRILFSINKRETISLISEIGIIPEEIRHDSTEEKLYTKVSDILFAKALKEMNFEVQVLRERSNCADIVAQSKFHGYSFIGDAKAFRLSRTAKNVKDFKVDSMAHWRGDHDYAVLTCPYFQYPNTNSQIYHSALKENIALFSWEYLYIFLSSNIKETQELNLSNLWNQSALLGQNITMTDANKCFIQRQDCNLLDITNIQEKDFYRLFKQIKKKITKRGEHEIQYYEDEINRIKQLDRESAIKELLVCMNFDSKIDTIKNYINRINK